ncbi:hypothetical protein OG905_06725 [Streptomyces sp. NBC_00322]|uniref:hypothetical protein n=1 Tax=Streptomyces sp. NBC_00322 TaxID=2975712 RepID=UPI002E2C99B8|nr:hypothetical protein [Streptomyces sp. NBC_00322]
MHLEFEMRRITTLAVTAAMAGGLLFAAAPAQAASAAQSGARAGHVIICDYNKMRAEVAELKTKAAKLDRLGAHAEAKKARAQADAIQRKIKSCQDAENNA